MDKKGRRLLETQGIAKAYGENRLFADSYFYINRGEKVGILGPNDCGKTTLLKIIRGKKTLDAGEIFLSQAARMSYVSQDLPQDEKTDFKSLVKDWRLNDQKLIFHWSKALLIFRVVFSLFSMTAICWIRFVILC